MNGRLKAVLLLLVMYGLGLASGIAWQDYHEFHPNHVRPAFGERRLQRLKSQLKLTDQQAQAIRDIFAKAHDRADQVNEEVSWDLADIHRDSIVAIRQVLSPSQMQAFEKLHKTFHARHPHMPGDEDDEESTSTAHGVNS